MKVGPYKPLQALPARLDVRAFAAIAHIDAGGTIQISVAIAKAGLLPVDPVLAEGARSPLAAGLIAADEVILGVTRDRLIRDTERALEVILVVRFHRTASD